MVERSLRIVCALLLLAAGAGLSFWITSHSVRSVDKDSIEYWAASKLLLRHGDPYDDASVFQLEQEAGAPVTTHAQLMFNPPCTLFFILPMGLFAPRVAVFLWSLMMIGCIVLSVRVLWVHNGRHADRSHLLAYVFAPVFACVVLGQIVALALLGISLFLWLERKRPLLSGLSLSLLVVKPQLFLPFGAVLLFRAFQQKEYRVLAGSALGVIFLCSVPLAFDHQIFSQYVPAIHSANAVSNTMPTLSSLVHKLHPQYGLLQYVLAICTCCWAVYWYIRRQQTWNWNREGLLLLMISVLVAPYSWFNDEVLMLPAVLNGIYECENGALIGFALIDAAALALVFFNVPLVTGAYIWTGPCWLAWFLYTRLRTPLLAPRLVN